MGPHAAVKILELLDAGVTEDVANPEDEFLVAQPAFTELVLQELVVEILVRSARGLRKFRSPHPKWVVRACKNLCLLLLVAW